MIFNSFLDDFKPLIRGQIPPNPLSRCFFVMYLVLQNSLCLCIYRSCNSALLSVFVSVCDLCERDRLKERETGSICLHVLITAISDQLHAYPVCRDLFTAALRPERTSVLLHFPRKFQGLDSRFECVCSGCKSLRCANRY